MDPTRQNAALVQVISEPEPPICGTMMELSMLFNYFGYQGPQNRFRTCESDQRKVAIIEHGCTIMVSGEVECTN